MKNYSRDESQTIKSQIHRKQRVLTNDASYKAWNGDPNSFPDIDCRIAAPMRAARPYAIIEGDDCKVDEEDDCKSDKQHREAFYRAVFNI